MQTIKHKDVTVPTKTGSAYTAGDVVGGLLTIDVVSGSGSGLIDTVQLVDDDKIEAALTLYFFNEAPTTIADDAAFNPSAADLHKMVGKVAISTYTTFTEVSLAVAEVARIFNALYGKLWIYVVCTATPTYTSTSGLKLRVNFADVM